MNKEREITKKCKWEAPELIELGVKNTQTGIGGSSVDFLNYDPTSPSATNTASS